MAQLGELNSVIYQAGLKERAREAPNVDPISKDVGMRLAFAPAQANFELKLADLFIDCAASGLDGTALVIGEDSQDRQIIFGL
ncbi:MAG TPA: hypothetical protein VGH58_00765 [Solirubrobacterales bacterium]|jgi:hypothetical protein